MELSFGSAILDVARTVNFITDPMDYSNAIVTNESSNFIKTESHT